MFEDQEYGPPMEQPEPFVPFSQSDDLEAQRLSHGMSRVRDQVNDGELLPEEGAELERQMAARIVPINQRRQQTEQMIESQQMQQIQRQSAAAQAMQLSNTQAAATHFASTMPRVTDIQGRTLTFFQPKPGEFQQVEGAGETPEAAIESGDANAPPPAPAGTGKEHVMTINNGRWSERAIFNEQGKLIRTEYPRDPNGREIRPPWVQAADSAVGAIEQSGVKLGLRSEELQQLRAQAELMTPRPVLTGNPKQDQLGFRQYADSMARNMRLLTLDAMRQRNIASAERNKAMMEEQRDERRANIRFESEYSRQFNALQREITTWRRQMAKNPNGEEAGVQHFAAQPENAGKSYLWDREAHEAEARSRAEAATLEKYPEWRRRSAGAPGGAPGPAGAAPKGPDNTPFTVTPKLPEGFAPMASSGEGKPDPQAQGKTMAAYEQLKAIADRAGKDALRGPGGAMNPEAQAASQAANSLAAKMFAYGHINAMPAHVREEAQKELKLIAKYR